MIIIQIDLSNKKDNNIFSNVKNLLNSISNSISEKNSSYYAVDRFENNFAICEDISNGKILNIEKIKLPNNTKESDIIYYRKGAYHIDIEKTIHRKEEIFNLINNLYKKN